MTSTKWFDFLGPPSPFVMYRIHGTSFLLSAFWEPLPHPPRIGRDMCMLPKMGKSEVVDIYTDEGITITTKHQSGATITEQWDRVCCEEGAYRLGFGSMYSSLGLQLNAG